jgi:hypothetical protein
MHLEAYGSRRGRAPGQGEAEARGNNALLARWGRPVLALDHPAGTVPAQEESRGEPDRPERTATRL